MSLGIVIPVVNCLKYTKMAVESIKTAIRGVEVIMIDNGSTDGTGEWARYCPRVDVYKPQGKNIGVAAAWNLGMKIALARGHDLVFVMNNDIVLHPDAIDALAAWTREGMRFPTLRGIPMDPALPYDVDDVPRAHVWSMPPDFCGFLMSRDVLKEVGGFDEEFRVAYCEDLDYAMRLKQAGIRMGSCHDAIAGHFVSRAIQEGGVKHWDAFTLNAKYFYRKWGMGYEEARTILSRESATWKQYD